MGGVNPLRLGVILIALATAAGCTTSTPDPESAPTTNSGPPADGGSYESIADLTDAMDTNGLRCTELEETVTGTATCNNGQVDVNLRIIDSPTALDQEIKAMEEAVWMPDGLTMLAGVNWTMVSNESYIRDAQEELGGRIVEAP